MRRGGTKNRQTKTADSLEHRGRGCNQREDNGSGALNAVRPRSVCSIAKGMSTVIFVRDKWLRHLSSPAESMRVRGVLSQETFAQSGEWEPRYMRKCCFWGRFPWLSRRDEWEAVSAAVLSGYPEKDDASLSEASNIRAAKARENAGLCLNVVFISTITTHFMAFRGLLG